MISWFGKSWGAPICEPDNHVKTPVGKRCERCKKLIEAEDEGVSMPLVESVGNFMVARDIYYHLQCHLDGIKCPGCPRCKPEKFS